MAFTTSPNLSAFSLSQPSRVEASRQLPAPICTTLPPLTPPGHSYTPRGQPLSADQMFAHHFSATGDSYFSHTHSNPASIPSSTASTPAPSSTRPGSPSFRHVKRTSISSLLSSPEDSPTHDNSGPSSPTYNWSTNTPPSTADHSRNNSVVSTPGGLCYNSTEYNNMQSRRDSIYSNGHDEDAKMYSASSSPRTKKSRPAPRPSVPGDNTNRDEYDVLGRKKPKTPRTPMSWDPKDDILLKQLKEEQRLGWKEIATHFRGRTSHACQFRWRRLASGQLKYYQGHRRPPQVTTTSASFASEMASSSSTATSPKVLMSGMQHNHMHNQPVSPTSSIPRAHPVLPNLPSPNELPPMHQLYHSQSWAPQSLFQPTPLPSPNSYAPRFIDEEPRGGWTKQEDNLLLDTKLSFDEVNVLLTGRTENEIWNRMAYLRGSQGVPPPRPQFGFGGFAGRRESSCYDERIQGIGAGLGYATSR